MPYISTGELTAVGKRYVCRAHWLMALQLEEMGFMTSESTALVEGLSVVGRWRQRLECAQDAACQRIVKQHVLQWGVVQP